MEFAGIHVLGELRGLPQGLTPAQLGEALTTAVAEGGGTLLQLIHHEFEPHGLTTLAMLAESHASIHVFPEQDALFFDVFTCGSADPERMAEVLVRELQPRSHRWQVIHRGDQAAT